MLILLIDDDTQYAEMSAETLRGDSHEVIIANSTRTAERVLGTGGPQCAILDLMEDHGGVDFARSLRARCTDLPIVFVSRSAFDDDLIAAYEAGADDFIAKPYNPRELVLRIRAVGRRYTRVRSAVPCDAPGHEMARRGEINDDGTPPARRGGLTFVDGSARFNGHTLNCTPLEVDILRELTWVPGQVLSYEQLNERVWGYSDGPGGTLLKGHVSSLRRKLKEAGGEEHMIRTVRGVGYAYAPD